MENTLRILTWNCQGAFRKKYPRVAELAPDVAVIQECEHPDRISWKQGNPPRAMLWFGESPTRGLGVLSWGELELRTAEVYDRSIRHCVPVEVCAPYAFHIVAVWAKGHTDSRLSYSGQVYQGIAAYRNFILETDTVFLGDFNSNLNSTPSTRIGNHVTLNNALRDLGMISAYHYAFQEPQGRERQATYYQGRRLERPYHIDYLYIPTRWMRRLRRVEVGAPRPWLEHSDHCPLWVDFAPVARDHVV